MRYFTRTCLDVTRFVLDRAQNVIVTRIGSIGRIGPIAIHDCRVTADYLIR